MQKKDYKNIIHLTETDSTNAAAIRMIQNGISSGTAIFSDIQTNGVGKLGRHFESKLGGLYFSYIIEEKNLSIPIGLITSATCIAVLDCIVDISGIQAKIKWPNDIVVQQKKLGGILAIKYENFIIIGIGINLMQTEFSNGIKEKAISLHMLTNGEYKNFDVAKLLKFKLDNIFLEKFSQHQLFSILNSKSDTLGKNVTLAMPSGEIICGLAVEIAPCGALVLNINGILKKIYSADIL